MFKNFDKCDKLKHSIIKVKLISVIILNILKLRDLQYNKDSSKLIDKFSDVKSISKLFYDVLTLNVYSILMNSLTNYRKIKDYYKYIMKKN
jgi:hypothetical protein